MKYNTDNRQNSEFIDKRFIYGTLLVFIHIPTIFADEFYFDPTLLSGSNTEQSIAKFNELEKNNAENDYILNVYVNNTLLETGKKISFKKTDLNNPDSSTAPCFDSEFIQLAEIKPEKPLNANAEKRQCYFLSDLVKEASWTFDQSLLKLTLTVPNAFLDKNPRGFIPVSQWESGTTALFIKHNTNFYQNRNTHNDTNHQYLWSNLNSGLNLGLWQLRNTSNFNYSKSDEGQEKHNWKNIQTYAQRPIASVDGLLTLGETYTDISLFDSLSFNGVKFVTDQRMLPQSKRGYAPEVRGIANTTARVIVRQQGNIIYETVVSPGPFVIDDLYNTTTLGDLDVEVLEADGQVSTFSVPFSAVPESVRPGSWNYQFALGRVRHMDDIDAEFLEAVVQRGISNRLTANSGFRVAKNYQAYLLGGVFATPVGAFGINSAFSRAKIDESGYHTGWRAEASFSKSLNTGTNIAIAAYRYSSKGFRDLHDVFGLRRALVNNDFTYYSNTFNQRNRLSAMISQSLGQYGNLNLNWSTMDYYGKSPSITQLQLAYSHAWKKISYNVNVSRQQISQYRYHEDNLGENSNNPGYNHSRSYNNIISLGISIPLDWYGQRSSLAFHANRSRSNQSISTALSGSAGKNNQISYSVYGTYDKDRVHDDDNFTWGTSLQKDVSVGTLRTAYSAGDGFRQFSVGASSSFVLHKGGLTLGPYLSDTFGIIHAKGADGAEVSNGQNAAINRFGYALIPSLTPYRYNTVSLDTRNMNQNAELQGGSRRVVPYAGAIPLLEFATLVGYPVIINTTLSDGSIIPMGADVTDDKNNIIGMVGQAGQIYARVSSPNGELKVSWGEDNSATCRVHYQLPKITNENFVHINTSCIEETK